MRILITGITGRIGANLAAALLKEGHQVWGLVWPKDDRTAKLRGLGVELLQGSLTEPADVRRAVAGMEAVYHLGAAFQGGGPFSEADYFEINVRGTFLVLEAARAEKGLRQLLFASTDAVYDKYVFGGMKEPIREDAAPRRPAGWYALSKSMGEELCNGYWRTYRTPVTILRFCWVVGAGEILDFYQFYLSKLRAAHPELEPLWRGEERLLLLKDPDGRPYKKHMGDVRDIVAGCVCALGKPEALGETFQLGGPGPFTWREAVPHLSQNLGIPYVEAVVEGTPTFYEFDISKARNLLGFQPRHDILRMIDDALAFQKGQDIGVLPTG
ncbi:MAG: NAD(P)-dependent oxidoreductase [Candidatus Latescibacteria bacterium]|nr:NAD(P)-dependent oxidoreductase [Candidatus Latescibacterota bacterium]